MKPVIGTELGTVYKVAVAVAAYTRMNEEIPSVLYPACDESE